ncbi:hypothetical protein [Nocardioides jejuensis]|uniref:Uncharacterized protein n=1 Tax=Nocardioides jejuensis TaxID=2502782 RepID=A0A4R1CHV9_9ACTN|nr:hypothetical protein [Nocardioides jejuensis]TCJ31033.1 hypothetical protein EPD65_00200 [Nocardioides jejuensis]
MGAPFELTARETRAVRVAVTVARSAGVVGVSDVIAVPVQGRFVVDTQALAPICRSLTHVAREIPPQETRARLGIARPELDALFARVVARWAYVAGL